MKIDQALRRQAFVPKAKRVMLLGYSNIPKFLDGAKHGQPWSKQSYFSR